MTLRLLLVLLILPGCASVAERSADPQPWTHLNFDNDADHFQFAIVGDRTGGHRPGIFEKGLAKLNLLRPEFVMSVGDLIEGYTKDEAEIDQQWDEIESFTAKLDAPFFYVPGNHDRSNEVQKQKWRSRFGPDYYHFVYRDVLFLALSTYDPESCLSSEQIAYFAKVLKENSTVRWTCIFMHEPLWVYKTETRWDEFERLLLDRPYTVFAGHHHDYTKYVRHDRRYLVLATTGGAMKRGDIGPELGAFDHVTWVTMRDDGPLVANIELDAIHDEDVRTEATAKLVNAVLSGSVLQISPVVTHADRIDRAAGTLTFTNDGDTLMTAQGRITPKGALRASPDRFELNVGPRSTATFDLELRCAAPTSIDDLQPLSIDWSASYHVPGRPPLRVPRADVIGVDQIRPCLWRNSSIVIDGKLDDWPDLPWGKQAAQASDLSFEFGVAHDEQHVYIAIRTTDDISVLSPLKEPWSQDGVEVRFDARLDPLRSQGRGRGEFKDILVISMSPGETPGQMVHHGSELLPPGVKAICVKTANGHATEIAIPVSYLNDRQRGSWQAFRMNVAVDDYDSVAGPLTVHWWRPDWRSSATFAGSGTFDKK